MKRSIIRPAEGSIFAVPIADGCNGFGVLARTTRQGSAFGYFFLPGSDPEKPSREQCVFAVKFGDHGLASGRWTVLGKIKDWNRDHWPLPPFARDHDNPELKYITRYNDDLKVIAETIVPAQSVPSNAAVDAQFGSAVVEKMLLTRLNSQ